MKKILFALLVGLVLVSLLLIGIITRMDIAVLVVFLIASSISFMFLGIFIVKELSEGLIHHKLNELKEGFVYKTNYCRPFIDSAGESIYLAILESDGDFDGSRYFELQIEPRDKFKILRNLNKDGEIIRQMVEVRDKPHSCEDEE